MHIVASAYMNGTKLSGNMKRGGRSDDTLDSGMGTLRSHGTGPAMESLLPYTITGDRRNSGVNASTTISRKNYRTRLRLFGPYWTPIPDAPPMLSPTRRTQLGLRPVDPSPVVPVAGPLSIIAQLQNDFHMLKMALPIQPNPVAGTQMVRRRSDRLTNTEVSRFSRDTCWDQHRQVFDAIVKSNGWDDDTAALQLLAHLEGDVLNVAYWCQRHKGPRKVGWSVP